MKSEVLFLIKQTQKSSTNPLWFMPFTQNETNEMLGRGGGSIIVYGAFSDRNELMGLSGLFPDAHEFKDITELLQLIPDETTELGGCMVLPKLRGKNLMLEINKVLLKIAKEKGFKTIIATAHPDNIASCKSLEALGMKLKAKITREGKYLRNIYLLKI